MFTVPPRQTELARTADLHILYRRAASAYAGAITPEIKAQLWAQAEKQVPPLKEKEIMTDTPAVKPESKPEIKLRFEALKDDNGVHVWRYIEAVQVEFTRGGYPKLRFRLQDSFMFKENENLWISGFTEDANALAKRGVDVSGWKVAGEYPVEPPVLVRVGYENMGKRDFRFRIREYEAENGEKPAPAPLKRGDKVRIVNDPDGDWAGKVGVIRQLRGNGKGGLAQAGVDIAGKYPDSRSERRYFRFEDLIAVAADDAKIDALVESHESVIIERPGGEHTIGAIVMSEANPAPDGMVAVQVAPGMVEAAQTVEVRRMEDVLAELGKAKERIAALEQELRDAKGGTAYGDLYTAYENLRKTLTEKDKQLAALHASQKMKPLNTGLEVVTLVQEIKANEQRIAADKELVAYFSEGWRLVPQLCASDLNERKIFLQCPYSIVEPKPDSDKPGNVRDFPVPDAELTTEDEGAASARASGLPVSASHGLGRGVGVRRA